MLLIVFRLLVLFMCMLWLKVMVRLLRGRVMMVFVVGLVCSIEGVIRGVSMLIWLLLEISRWLLLVVRSCLVFGLFLVIFS